MKWTRVAENCLGSDCGKYHVVRARVGERTVYQLVRLGTRWSGINPQRGWDGSESLLVADTAKECQSRAESDGV